MAKTILGSLVGGALGAYGHKVEIPQLPLLDTAEEQRKATAGNIAALPGLEELSGAVNRFSYDQISQMLERSIPGFAGAIRKASESAQALEAGEVPEDVSRFVQRSSAARALGGGFGGSGLGRNLGLRDLGLTSLQATAEGQNRTLALGGFARQTFPTFDFTNAFISPQQKISFDWGQNVAQFQRNMLAAQVKAAPDPATAELGQALDNFFDTVKNIGLAYAGGGMGMGGMMGMMGGGASTASAPGGTAGHGSASGNSWFGYGYNG